MARAKCAALLTLAIAAGCSSPSDDGNGGGPPFNVVSAASTGHLQMHVTFDGPPNAGQATALGHYDVPGLALSGTPALAANTVTLTTSAQAATDYTITVTGVTRAGDSTALTTKSATFAGRAGFNVASAASTGHTAMVVLFDAPPNAVQAAALANYDVPGLTLSGTPLLSGNSVFWTTSAQSGNTYTVTVSGVTRASDGETLTTTAAAFPGTACSAAATGSITTVSAANISDGETFTLNDGVLAAVVFEFDKSGNGVTAGRVQVSLSVSGTASDVRDAIIAAVNAHAIAITAANGGATLVNLTADTTGTAANQAITETVANAGFVVTGMSGGC